MKKYKIQTRLSIHSLDQLIKTLEIKKKSYPIVALRIADRLVDIMLDNAYPDTYIVRARLRENGKSVVASMRNDKPKWTYHEFGTGIIGSQFPHVAEALQKAGWKYDVNNHGESGWWYPTTDSDPNPYKWTDSTGQLHGWTRGLVAERAFWDAMERAKECFYEVATEELEREANK